MKVRTDDGVVLADQVLQEGAHARADVYLTENSPELMLLTEANAASCADIEAVATAVDKGQATVGIINGGQIRQFASPETLYTHPANPDIARFLGEANIVPGTASVGAVDTALGQLSLSELASAPGRSPAIAANAKNQDRFHNVPWLRESGIRLAARYRPGPARGVPCPEPDVRGTARGGANGKSLGRR